MSVCLWVNPADLIYLSGYSNPLSLTYLVCVHVGECLNGRESVHIYLLMIPCVVSCGIWSCWGVRPCWSSWWGIRCRWAISTFSSCVYPRMATHTHPHNKNTKHGAINHSYYHHLPKWQNHWNVLIVVKTSSQHFIPNKERFHFTDTPYTTVTFHLWTLTWHMQHLHSVQQSRGDGCCGVCRGDEEDLWKVKGHIEVVVSKTVVLLWVQNLIISTERKRHQLDQNTSNLCCKIMNLCKYLNLSRDNLQSGCWKTN